MVSLVEINGIKIKYRSECDDWAIIKEVFYENPYQVELIPMRGVVVDLGAHIGTFSLRCVKERDCKVYAYEPCSETFALLEENVKLNGFEEYIKLFRLAVASSTQPRRFSRYPSSCQSARFNRYIDEPEGWVEEEVQCVTLRQIFENNGLPYCDFLKLDVEGAEREIFNSESELYFKRAKRIAMEWHSYDGHIYEAYLRRLGFSTKLTLCGYPLPEYNPNFARGMLFAWKP